jgi:hypothetical protein
MDLWTHIDFYFLTETGVFILYKKNCQNSKRYRWQGAGTSTSSIGAKVSIYAGERYNNCSV